MSTVASESTNIHLLSVLMFQEGDCAEAIAHVSKLGREGRKRLLAVADANHVLVRACKRLAMLAGESGNHEVAAWAAAAALEEEGRIIQVLPRLAEVCSELERNSIDFTVMKTFDHWPDLGRDIDAFTLSDENKVIEVLTQKFEAEVEPRSWGDCLARKRSFSIPGLGKTLEVHTARLGQVGEQTKMAERIVRRRVQFEAAGELFYVPAAEERVIAATLQRMYRHFFFRISDVANSAALLESGELDLAELRKAAEIGGIWPGVVSYLNLITNYVMFYREAAAGNTAVQPSTASRSLAMKVKGRFLRIPIFPSGATLYARELLHFLTKGDVLAGVRLALLPPLACAAGISFKVTGSNQGIW